MDMFAESDHLFVALELPSLYWLLLLVLMKYLFCVLAFFILAALHNTLLKYSKSSMIWNSSADKDGEAGHFYTHVALWCHINLNSSLNDTRSTFPVPSREYEVRGAESENVQAWWHNRTPPRMTPWTFPVLQELLTGSIFWFQTTDSVNLNSWLLIIAPTDTTQRRHVFLICRREYGENLRVKCSHTRKLVHHTSSLALSAPPSLNPSFLQHKGVWMFLDNLWLRCVCVFAQKWISASKTVMYRSGPHHHGYH